MHFGARAGRADARRRDAGDAAEHRRGAATPQMPARRRAFTHLDSGDLDEARDALNRARPEDRENLQLPLARALLLAKEGKAAQARLELDDRVQRWAALVPYATPWVADVYSELGDTESALQWLEMAIRNGDRRLAWFRRDPHLARIRSHPRFGKILALGPAGNSASGPPQ